ncbi:ABC transporter permease [Oricola thermophila]|uniref:ABC transporter permease n=1 Tax=Oricola thermophila TaxID=2742145 RepID=A0A6N1VJT6_9HYPH|nr:ABC transporter permease [Oricola thermophila]QKV19489.1 ABC transporter permease [Oricola thermophila]
MFAETVRQALQAILRNAMRSFLTILGVIIGVAAVITMVTIGQGSTVQIEADVSKLGTNLLIIRPGTGMGPSSSGGSAPRFSLQDVDAIREQVPRVLAVAPVNSSSLTVVHGNENHPATVTGTDNDFLVARDWNLALGREFYDSELRAGSAACILGETVRQELFGAGDPVGSTVRMGQISCRVIGLLEAKGASSFGQDQDDVVLIPVRAFMRRIAGHQDVSSMYVAVQPGYSTERAQATIEALLRERRRIALGEEDDFSVMDTKEITSMLTSITGVMTGLLSAVAAISLLVGGIGIMNIMLVSVTERTREIGIRLAIGATEGQVLMQFLVEAIVLSLFGGLIGIALGLALGYAGSAYMKVPFSPDWTVTAIAFLFSAFIGIVFGYFPARRAARLDPIEALRHE